MGRKAIKTRSIETDVLIRLKTLGAFSHVMQARLDFMESEGLSRYACAMLPVGHPLRSDNTEVSRVGDRVYPDVLPTAQVSFRTSTTKPPLVNFPSRDGYGEIGRAHV